TIDTRAVIAVGDLKSPAASMQTFNLLLDRKDCIKSQVESLQTMRQSTDLLFNWEDVPGDQNAVTSLEKFLGARFKLSWISGATVTRSTDGATITVLGGRGPQAPAITLKLTADRASALVTLWSAGEPPSETFRLPAVPQGGKLAIYS